MTKGFSTLIAILVISAVVIAAIFSYSFINKEQKSVPGQNIDRQIEDLKSLSGSDEIGDIEKDLNSTNLENLDAEITQVENDLGKL